MVTRIEGQIKDLEAAGDLHDGRSAGLDGRWDITLACVREMLEVDPSDHLGAKELAREAGLISPVDAEAGMAMRM